MNLRQQLATSSPYEELLRFDVQDREVRGLLCMPDYRVVPCPTVLLCHGFAGSRNDNGRLLLWLARALAHRNIGALLMDFRGCGESEGDFNEMSIRTMLEDVTVAVTTLCGDLRVDKERIGIMGHSLGGLVAACAAGDDKCLKALALWGAVGDTRRIQERFSDGADSRTSTGWDAGGLEVSEAFRDSAMDLDVQLRYVMSTAPVLVAHGTEDESVPFDHAKLFVENANRRARHFKLISVDGADHCFRRLPWREEIVQGTVDWFMEHLEPKE
ncbi:MAG: alpha/beta hydrolase family protein [Planctomycetota bacterium]|jgi:dipeptidyl aminopeptidase/acylaminoacyl peptidase